MLRLNNQGGTIPSNETDKQRAEAADLITLPRAIEGTNCFNCEYIRPLKGAGARGVGDCVHPDVAQMVTFRQCCIFWNAPGTRRDF
jgi:hypothetical protein